MICYRHDRVYLTLFDSLLMFLTHNHNIIYYLNTGNGHFISKTGQAGSALDFNLLKEDSKVFEMPEDVLASAKSLERNYEAITINPGKY